MCSRNNHIGFLSVQFVPGVSHLTNSETYGKVPAAIDNTTTVPAPAFVA